MYIVGTLKVLAIIYYGTCLAYEFTESGVYISAVIVVENLRKLLGREQTNWKL